MASYFTMYRSLLWTLLIFLVFCAFAAMKDEWIGWVRRFFCRGSRARKRALGRGSSSLNAHARASDYRRA
jgi:hypothetical protein